MSADGRVALVTGANRGIGRDVVRQLSERGYNTILTARDQEKGEAAASELGVEFRCLDVANPASVEALASTSAWLGWRPTSTRSSSRSTSTRWVPGV